MTVKKYKPEGGGKHEKETKVSSVLIFFGIRERKREMLSGLSRLISALWDRPDQNNNSQIVAFYCYRVL